MVSCEPPGLQGVWLALALGRCLLRSCYLMLMKTLKRGCGHSSFIDLTSGFVGRFCFCLFF